MILSTAPSLLCAQPLFRRVVLSPVSQRNPKSFPSLRAVPQTQTEEEDKRHGIPWACSLSHESFLQPNLTLLTLYTAGTTQDSALGHPFLPGPSPLGHLPVLAEGLMEREGGTVLVDPGLVIIVLSPLSSPELLSPEQAHPRTGHQVHFLRESAKVTRSYLLVLIFGAVPG